MSIRNRERKPAEHEEIVVCDICRGEIVGEEAEDHDFDDCNFHRECWDNSADWVKECPETLFLGELPYGDAVEAVRNNKYLLFIDGDEDQARVIVCDDKDAMDGIAGELDLAEESIEGVVVNNRFYNAYAHVTVRYNE